MWSVYEHQSHVEVTMSTTDTVQHPGSLLALMELLLLLLLLLLLT